MEKTIFFVIAAAFLFSGLKCGSNTPTQNGSTGSTPTSQSPNTIIIQNLSFNPATLTIKKGETVTWINEDSATHTVNSNIFNSENLSKGENFSFTFPNAGTFNYACNIHPSMKGIIVVQ